ncbi:MAG: ketopantoate reductase family protein [Janthinobacterium lividum]
MRILMVGAGATGGYFGGKLAQAGRDLTFLLRAKRAEQVRKDGLQIASPMGDFTVQPKVVTADELREKAEVFDLIVISTKAYQLEGAMDDIAPAVGPETMVLPILNGMRQLSILEKRFGAAAVLGGSVRIHADVDEQDHIEHKTKLSELSFGERSGERTPRIEAVERELQGAGFDAILQTDILATMWQKWWILASLGSICVLSRGTIGQAAAAPHGRAFAESVVNDCIEIAAANGYPANPGMLAEHMERMTAAGSTMSSSLYRDMTKGAPVEADHILGDLLDHAKGVKAPLITAAYVQLKVYEAGRTA